MLILFQKRGAALKIKPPYFITFEGGEGAGKTTLINRLKELFEAQGFMVLVTREPGGTPLGEAIRELLLHRDKGLALGHRAELLLFLSARAQHVEERISPALKEGKVVLCDRFSDSSVAYQGYARKLGMKEVEALNLFATGGLIPDLTFFLDLDPHQGLARASKVRALDHFEEEKLDFHKLVREGFLKQAEDNPKRMRIIDASSSQDQVFDQVTQILSL